MKYDHGPFQPELFSQHEGKQTKNVLGLKFLILEQSVTSRTEKAQADVNDEHKRAHTTLV